jgi:hypothetical protein
MNSRPRRQAYGQQDNITVLTLTFVPVAVTTA